MPSPDSFTRSEPRGLALTPSKPLPLSTLALYALPGAAVNFLLALMLVAYLNYAVEVLGASATLVGAVFLGARLWDGLSDPLAGYWSDRTRSRLGRRKSWMLASCPLLALFGAASWAPPAELSGAALGIWIAVSVFGFYTAYTLFEVPHLALGAELTQDRRDRVRVFGTRHLVRTLGLFAAFALGAAMLEDLETARVRLGALTSGAGVAAALLILVAVVALPRERSDYAHRGPLALLQAARDVWSNRNARILLYVQAIENFGVGGIGVLAPFVVRHVLRAPELIMESLLAFAAPMLLSIPVWMRLGQRFDKRKLWMRAMGMSACGFGLLLFVDEGRFGVILAAALIASGASGCAPTVGVALKADVIDADELATGERKGGAYFAAWNLVTKAATGLVIGVVGLALDLSGFEGGAEVQSDLARNTMVWLMGGLPLLGFASGMWIFRRFDLSEEEHARVLERLASRHSAP